MREKRIIIGLMLAISLVYGMTLAECIKSKSTNTCNPASTSTCPKKCGSSQSSPTQPVLIRIIRIPRIIFLPAKVGYSPSFSKSHRTVSKDKSNIPADIQALKNKKDDYTPPTVLIGRLKEIFTYAGENTNDANIAETLEKLFDAHVMRIIYETSFTEQFQKKIEERFPGDETDKLSAIETAKIIAGQNYWYYLTEFQNAKTQNTQVSNKVREALKKGVVQKTRNDKAIYGQSDLKMSGNYLSRMLACAAVNPRTGCILQPSYTGELNIEQNVITDRVVGTLNEMAGIYEKADANDVKEPNSLMANGASKTD
jgi:hypothetical protein